MKDLTVQDCIRVLKASPYWEAGGGMCQLFDICDALYLYASRYHTGQWSQLYSVLGWLSMTMKYSPAMVLSPKSLRKDSERGYAFYKALKRA